MRPTEQGFQFGLVKIISVMWGEIAETAEYFASLCGLSGDV